MGGKVRVLKDVGGGLRGSTSGLRFNPREAPEFAEEDRNLGRDDPEARELYEEKRRKEREENRNIRRKTRKQKCFYYHPILLNFLL